MDKFIKITEPNTFLLSKDLLGLDEAQLWIGPSSVGPSDNDDQRVRREREAAEKNKGEEGWRISGIEAQEIALDPENPGWYKIDTSEWMPGTYRFNVHSKDGVQAPKGTPLRPIRDGQYSWPGFSDEDLENLPEGQKDALYLENNNAGFCMRLTKNEDGTLEFAGNGREWIADWPEIKKQMENHYDEKMKEAS